MENSYLNETRIYYTDHERTVISIKSTPTNLQTHTLTRRSQQKVHTNHHIITSTQTFKPRVEKKTPRWNFPPFCDWQS